jgi:Ca2+-dependent lipid-binding protein
LFALLEVGFKLFPFPLSLEHANFSALLRLKLDPLVPIQPYIGAVSLSFLRKPHVDFSFKVMGVDAMSVSIPGVLSVADSVIDAIKGAIENICVYPTFLVIPLAEDEAMANSELTRPPPKGILQFTVHEAKGNEQQDT